MEDEPLFCERAAGIGIGKAVIMVTIRVPGKAGSGRRRQETREFRTVRAGLLAMAGWLRGRDVARAGMEAAGDYRKPVYFLPEREGFSCDLYPASQVKALPGRPETDRLDSVWLAKITGRGPAASGFVPPEDIRVLRAHTRYRRRLVQARTAEMGRCEKLLEDACVKLSPVITSIHGVSGRDMLNAIIAGQRDPKVLAQLARRRMRGKIPQLEEALDRTFFTGDHAFIFKMMLGSIDHLSAQVKELDARIGVLCEPYERLEAESLGTQAWFALVGPILDALNDGGMLTIDEIDASLHPHLTSEILRIFSDPKRNPKQAQLLFTSHDTTLLGGLLGGRELTRDQVWFTEKKADGATVLYPLTDFSPRKTENLERGYLQGRYGAIPFLDGQVLEEIADRIGPGEDGDR